MIYVILTYLFFPFLRFAASLKKEPGFKRILIIQTAKIGDVVCSTPVFREIKKKYPSAFLVLMGDPVSQQVLDNNPYIDKFILVKQNDMSGLSGKLKVANMLRKNNFDISISLQPNVANNVIPIWALIPRRYSVYPNSYGLTYKCSAFLNTMNVAHILEQNIVDTYIKLLNKAIEVPESQDSSRLELHSSGRAETRVDKFLEKAGIKTERLVGIAPAARNKLKELKPDIFAGIADGIQKEFGCKAVLIAGPGDETITGEVKRLMATDPVDSCSVFTLSELSALLSKLSLFISVDSGPVYMAEAMNVPVINIAGPCDMGERPHGDKFAIVQKKIPCVPCSYTYLTAERCSKGSRECIETISVDEVLVAAKSLLSG
jgi:lipopolysaccharide heptosyltransferase II